MANPTPSTPVIDTFNRTSENPLSDGGKWTTQVLTGDESPFTDGSVCTHNGTNTPASAYRNDQNYGPDCEAGFTLSVVPGSDSGGFRVYLRLQGSGLGSGTPNGYYVDVPRIRNHAPTSDEWRFVRVDNGAPSQLGASTFGPNVGAGDQVAFNMVGGVMAAWHKPSGGSWTLVATQSDGVFPNAGKIGVFVNSNIDGSPAAFDNFFGGTLVAAVPMMGAICIS